MNSVSGGASQQPRRLIRQDAQRDLGIGKGNQQQTNKATNMAQPTIAGTARTFMRPIQASATPSNAGKITNVASSSTPTNQGIISQSSNQEIDPKSRAARFGRLSDIHQPFKRQQAEKTATKSTSHTAPKQPLPAQAAFIQQQAAMRHQAAPNLTFDENKLFIDLNFKKTIGTINPNEQQQLTRLEDKKQTYIESKRHQQSLEDATKNEVHYAKAPSLDSDEAPTTKSPTFDEFDYDAELKKRNNANPYDSIDTPLD